MIKLTSLATVAVLGLTAAACQTDTAMTGAETNAAATVGADATGFKPVTQVPGTSEVANQPGIPGESVAQTRSPGARENGPIQP